MVPESAVAGWAQVPRAAAAGWAEFPWAAAAGWEEFSLVVAAGWEACPWAAAAGCKVVPRVIAAGCKVAQHEVTDFDLVLLLPRMEATVALQFCYSNQCNFHHVYNQHQVVYKVSHETKLPTCQT